MEAPPDPKRARLDHEHLAYPPSGPVIRPASTPSTTAAPHHSHAEHALPGQPYSTPNSAPPPAHPSGHLSALPLPYSRENGADVHRRASYQATTSQLGFQDQHPGYGPVVQTHPGPYPRDPASTLPPNAPLPPAVDQRQRAHSSGHEGKMADQQYHGLPGPSGPPPTPGAAPYPIQHVNGMPNGMQYHAPPEQYAVGPMVHHQDYPQTPGAGYPQTPGYHQASSAYGGVQRRKQVRATQVSPTVECTNINLTMHRHATTAGNGNRSVMSKGHAVIARMRI